MWPKARSKGKWPLSWHPLPNSRAASLTGDLTAKGIRPAQLTPVSVPGVFFVGLGLRRNYHLRLGDLRDTELGAVAFERHGFRLRTMIELPGGGRSVDTPGHGLSAPRTLERSSRSRFTTNHGGRSIGTWLISQNGRHVLQHRKASVSLPPTGSSTDGSISTDPGEPQTSPVYRILMQRKRVIAKQRSRRCSALGSMGRGS
jgi:hypothetical protein